ncbi:MAG: 1-acyl-sn-glycerol-3-phosphate acyltransferase [Chitinophagaceae bacterium]
MLYQCLKIIVRLAMLIFCRRIIINNRAILKKQGPLLLASNHPNSFLDAVILDILFKKPIWSLTRGDVFKNKFIGSILKALKMFPVYRVSEGAENLNYNYETFENCKRVFREKGIVLIFSEGKCINEWHLRPLKKGTARLAITSWEENIPVEVLPVGINYSSFRRFGKNIIINFGDILTKQDIAGKTSEGIRYQTFNTKLQEQLNALVFEIGKQDKEKKQELLEKKPSFLRKIALAIPAFIGWLVHVPLYIPVHRSVLKRTAHNDHFDSVMAAILLFIYPFYLLLISFIAFYITKSPFSFLFLLLMPFTAWCYVQLKPQLDK